MGMRGLIGLFGTTDTVRFGGWLEHLFSYHERASLMVYLGSYHGCCVPY